MMYTFTIVVHIANVYIIFLPPFIYLVHGVPKKMSLSEKGNLLAKGHFFWDTLYIRLIS